MIKITVIVPTYNRADGVKDTIECLLRQKTNDRFEYEIIVVDNNSKDHTSKVLAIYAQKYPGRMTHLFEPRQGKSYALNTAIKVAQGEIISCVDDDCLMENDYLENLFQVFQEQALDVGVLGGKISPKWIGKNYPHWLDRILNEPSRYEDGTYNWFKVGFEGTLGIMDFGDVPFILDYSEEYHLDIKFYGANMAFRKNILVQCGGFDISKRTGQDTEICERLFHAGIKGIYAPSVKLFHKIDTRKGSPLFFYRWWFGRGMSGNLQKKSTRTFMLRVWMLLVRSFEEKDLFKKVNLRWKAFFNFGQMIKSIKNNLVMIKNRHWVLRFVVDQKCLPWNVILQWRRLLSFLRDQNRHQEIRHKIETKVTHKLNKFQNKLNTRGIVLMYHRIIQLDYDPRHLSVSPTHFEEQLQVIKKYGQALQITKMGNRLKEFSFGPLGIVVTLDDGYADNYLYARPVLEKHGIPATFFITSGAIDSRQEFFWDGLERTILVPQSLPEIFEIEINHKKYSWDLKSEGTCFLLDYSKTREGIPENGMTLSRIELYITLVQLLGGVSTDQKNDALVAISNWANQTLTVRPDSLPMTSSELLSLSRCPLFEIGSHTVNHPSLNRLSLEEQEEEIFQSKQDLENRLSRTITSFCYPHGSYDEHTVDILKRLKFQNACTVVARPVMRNISPYLLPRFVVKDWDGDEFEKNLRSWLAEGI